MSDDYFVWSCPIKKITKCQVSPRLIESQFTVSTRRSFAIKRTKSPIYHLASESKKFAKFVSKIDHATSSQLPVPKRIVNKQDLDKNIVTTQRGIEVKNLKTVATRKYRSPSSRTSKCRIRKPNTCANRSIQTERQGVFSHFTSMVDGIGTAVVDKAAPWIPYVGATAVAIVLLGYFSKKVEKALCIYKTANELLSKFPLNDIDILRNEGHDADESPIPEPSPTNGAEPPPTIGATVDPNTLRFHYEDITWPLEQLRREF